MQAIKDIFRIGKGPSSSHTIAPYRACDLFLKNHKDLDHYKVELYGSLALTGKGHKTDAIIKEVLGAKADVHFCLKLDEEPRNIMIIKGYQGEKLIDTWHVESLGGGSIKINEYDSGDEREYYPHDHFDDIKAYCKANDLLLIDYILKFETSNSELFGFCKPNDSLENRLECIHTLSRIGYRVGSGNIVGLPGQTLDDLVSDLKLVHELPLSMNSATIFIPAENSDFAHELAGDPIHTLNMMALMRIMNPDRLMPTTSSLEKMIPDGQYLGLLAGANTITIHDGTPEELQQYFPIYSSKRIRPQLEHFRAILEKAQLKTDNLN